MNNSRTATPWEFTNYTKFDGSPILTAQDVADVTAQSALKSDIAELWGVSMPGGNGLVICYTGNGPTSKANAEFIARACNAHDGLLTSLKALLRAAKAAPEMQGNAYIDLGVQVNTAIAKAEGWR